MPELLSSLGPSSSTPPRQIALSSTCWPANQIDRALGLSSGDPCRSEISKCRCCDTRLVSLSQRLDSLLALLSLTILHSHRPSLPLFLEFAPTSSLLSAFRFCVFFSILF